MAKKVAIPRGDKVTIDHGKLRVPDTPIIAFIEGDGSTVDFECTHTMSPEHIEWFQAGSALNVIRRQQGR